MEVQIEEQDEEVAGEGAQEEGCNTTDLNPIKNAWIWMKTS